MNYTDLGNNTTNNVVMLLHGWGGSSKSLIPLAKELLAQNIFERAIVVDLPGFGESTKPSDDSDSYTYAELVKELADSLNLKEFSIVGHSFGGGIATILVQKYPDQIKNIVLIAAAVVRQNRETRLVRSLKKLLGNNYDRMKSYAKPLSKIYRKGFVQGSDTGRIDEMQNIYENIINQDLTDVASQITQPVLILWGNEDKYTPIQDGRKIASLIANSEFIELEGGHGLPLKEPQLVASKIKSYLEK